MIGSPSAERRTSHSIPAPASSAARKAAMLFSGMPGPWSPRCANPCRPGSNGSGADLDDRIHLDRDTEWKDRYANRRACVPAGFAEDLLHQLGGPVGDLRLVDEIAMAVDENAQLHDSLDPVERAKGRLHLGQQHNSATASGGLSRLQVQPFSQTAFDQAAVLGKADLAGDMQQAVGLDRGDIAGDRRGRFG